MTDKGRRIVLTLEYDGTDFHGWQLQPEIRTVQGVLQEALSQMMGEEIKVSGSGRTDAGVHAKAQVAHADIKRDIPPENIALGLNSILPRDVRVTECRDEASDFHAQFSATGKRYIYHILNIARPTALMRHRVWHIRNQLDVDAMREGADFLKGTHDFIAFKSAGDESTTIRDLRVIEIDAEGENIFLTFEASGFLKHMVRNITGALVEVGEGKLTPLDIKGLLESRSRVGAPSKAPPQGLTLIEVYY